MKKVIKEGKVAVLYSPGYGAGWFTWNSDFPQCIFSPDIVDLVLSNRSNEITDDLCKDLFETQYFYTGGACDLCVMWLEEGTRFTIDEYDGSESINIIDQIQYITA